MKQDIRSALQALRQGSPVVTDAPADVQAYLLRRYVEVSIRNSKLSLFAFGLTLFAIAYEAPLWPRIAAFAVLVAMMTARASLGRTLLREMDPAQPRSNHLHDVLVVIASSLWGIAPFVLKGWISEAHLYVVIYGSVTALAVLAVSYVSALPASIVSVLVCAVPMLVFNFTQGTVLFATMGVAALMLVGALMSRVRVSHETLLHALGAERENAVLVKELEALRGRLERENAALGDSLRDVSQAASRDPLTGCFNRRHLGSFAEPLAAMVLEERELVTVLIVDIDHFKRVNDVHGHPVGDEVLRAVAQMLGTRLRDHDCLVRFGGEEFVVVLRRCDVHRGRRVAEALRHNVASAEIDTDDGIVPITVSIGVAQWGPGESLDEVIQRADRTLYRAKQAGRDRVEVDARDALNQLYAAGGDSTLPGQLH